jgi:hypothetical protein
MLVLGLVSLWAHVKYSVPQSSQRVQCALLMDHIFHLHLNNDNVESHGTVETQLITILPKSLCGAYNFVWTLKRVASQTKRIDV